MGTIEHPTNPSTEPRFNCPVGITPPTPLLRIPGEAKHEEAVLPEPQPPSRQKYPLPSAPGCIREVATGADSSTDIQDSIVRWRDKVPNRWDPLNVGSDSAPEDEVSNGQHSHLLYRLMPLVFVSKGIDLGYSWGHHERGSQLAGTRN